MPYSRTHFSTKTRVVVTPPRAGPPTKEEEGRHTYSSDDIEVPVETAEAQMSEIRKALLTAQAEEDATVEARFLKQRQRQYSPASRNSVAMTEASSAGGSPVQRRTNYVVVDDDDDEIFDGLPEDDEDEPCELQQEGDVFRQAEAEEHIVLYNEGATELFRSIEECDWERAKRVLDADPRQAASWVVSTGTVNTTFNWSLWKRLPLHEAARRQAPADFLTQLIRAFPAAVSSVTQFGELPLHLAVECGAAPAVVNLLAAHHWMGCHATDQSGRSPLDILQEADLVLAPMDQRAVADALTATVSTWQKICEEQSATETALRDQHAAGLAAVRKQHDDDLAEECSQQEKMLHQVASLQQQLAQQSQVMHQQQAESQLTERNESFWKDRVELLQLENTKWKQAYKQEQSKVQELQQTVATRDEEAVVLSDQILDLQTALCRLADWHQTTVQKKLQTVNRTFQAALSELTDFTGTMTDHEEDLQSLLYGMGVDSLKSNSIDETVVEDDHDAVGGATTPKRQGRSPSLDDYEHHNDSDASEDIMDDEAMLRAARAASNVLRG